MCEMLSILFTVLDASVLFWPYLGPGSIRDPEILKLLVDSLIVARTQRDAIRLFTAAISLNNNDF